VVLQCVNARQRDVVSVPYHQLVNTSDSAQVGQMSCVFNAGDQSCDLELSSCICGHLEAGLSQGRARRGLVRLSRLIGKR